MMTRCLKTSVFHVNAFERAVINENKPTSILAFASPSDWNAFCDPRRKECFWNPEARCKNVTFQPSSQEWSDNGVNNGGRNRRHQNIIKSHFHLKHIREYLFYNRNFQCAVVESQSETIYTSTASWRQESSIFKDMYYSTEIMTFNHDPRSLIC